MSRLALLVALLLGMAGAARAQQAPPRFYNPLSDLTVSEGRPGGLYGYESKVFRLSGYYRVRGDLLSNLDLGHGLTPQGTPLWPSWNAGLASNTVTAANMRLRLQPEVLLGREARVVMQVDALDNVVFGSTPRGFPANSQVPQVSGSPSQEPPASGVNSFGDSLRVKKVWGELTLPFGMLQVGRVGNNWGLGIMANAGDGLDHDFDDSVDRVGFVTSLFDHFIGLAYDVNASGPGTASHANPLGQPQDVTNRDDVATLSLAVLRYFTPEVLRVKLKADRAVLNYGAYVTWRRQSYDVPTYWLLGIAGADRDFQDTELVPRDVDYLGGDLWLRLNLQRLRVELEAAYVWGRAGNASLMPGIEMPALSFGQWGGVLQAEWQPGERSPLSLRGEVGLASGDPAWGFGAWPSLAQTAGHPGDLEAPQIALPGDRRVDNFRFHPNFHVDEILWRRIVGTFTDGMYGKARLRWLPHPALRVDLAAVYSRTFYAQSAPGLAKPLGVEGDASVTWFARGGFEATAVYALLYPLAGFRNYATGVDPSPAHFAEVRLAFVF